jgi:hypothetical protein
VPEFLDGEWSLRAQKTENTGGVPVQIGIPEQTVLDGLNSQLGLGVVSLAEVQGMLASDHPQQTVYDPTNDYPNV